MAFKAKSVISLKHWIADNLVVLSGPVKKTPIAYWLTFGPLAFVFRIQLLAEVTGVRKVKGDVVCIEAAFEACDFSIERTQYLFEVGSNGD
jgi:hypothetical protein